MRESTDKRESTQISVLSPFSLPKKGGRIIARNNFFYLISLHAINIFDLPRFLLETCDTLLTMHLHEMLNKNPVRLQSL